MTKEQLLKQIKTKQSFLCIGLDTDIQKIPRHLLKFRDPVLEFNRQIIDSTHDLCVAYKPNLAFYEALGSKGWQSLEKTMKLIPRNIFTIADAKRGDIGNTSALYAKAFFETLNFDAVTVSPYMGSDSVLPFINFKIQAPGNKKEAKEKWVILLALTSNEGAKDFQMGSGIFSAKEQKGRNGKRLFEKVLEVSKQWGSAGNMMYVVGATRAAALKSIRKIIPHHFLLIPGVGAQGGSLKEVCRYGINKDCGLLVNASRSILYASSGKDFAHRAREEAKKMQHEMKDILDTATSK